MTALRSRAVLQRTTFRGTLDIGELKIGVKSLYMYVCCDCDYNCSSVWVRECADFRPFASPSMCQVWSYMRTMEAKFPSLQKISAVSQQCSSANPTITIPCVSYSLSHRRSSLDISTSPLFLMRCAAAEPGTMGVRLERQYFNASDPDTEVAPEDRVKGYRYGKTIVRVTFLFGS